MIELAEEVIAELSAYSKYKMAFTNQYGEVLKTTDNFSLQHDPLDVKSSHAIPVTFDSRKVGFLYVDEDVKKVKENRVTLKSIAEGAAQKRFYSEILTNDEKRIDQILYEFFRTDRLNTKDAKNTLTSLGVNIARNRLAIILEISDPNFFFWEEKEVVVGERDKKISRVKRELISLLSSFYNHHKDNLVGYLGANHFVVLKDMGSDPEVYQEEFKKTLNSLFWNIKEELRSDIVIGVGCYKPGLDGLKDSFSEAETALRFGKQIWGSDKIFHFDHFGVVAPLFSGVNEKNITFSRKLIEKLSAHPELLHSLDSYFENDISLSRTAKKLKIHRNTLVYRLEKIAEITELDPRVFNDAFQLQIALILNKYGVHDGE